MMPRWRPTEWPNPTVITVSAKEARLAGPDKLLHPHTRAGASIRYSQKVFSQPGVRTSPGATGDVGAAAEIGIEVNCEGGWSTKLGAEPTKATAPGASSSGGLECAPWACRARGAWGSALSSLYAPRSSLFPRSCAGRASPARAVRPAKVGAVAAVPGRRLLWVFRLSRTAPAASRPARVRPGRCSRG